MDGTRLTFEDFSPGTRFPLPAYPVSREAVIDFASRYDPQPFHLDEEAAKASLLGGLSASGWHTCAMMMRMMVDGYLGRSTSQGASHVEFVRWLRPVRPGDTLTGECIVEDARPSSSRSGLGLATIAVELRNQTGQPVLAGRYLLFLLQKGVAPSPAPLSASAEPPLASSDAPGAPPEETDYSPDRFWDVFDVGRVDTLGSHVFTEEDIVRFARDFDPQYFHLDREAATASLLGGLCASGWQVSANMMRLLVATNRRHVESWMKAKPGREAPLLGPSPGYRDLRWLRPVRPGDILTYVRTVTGKRPSDTRPGWGIVETAVTASDQAGRPAFSMKAAAFMGTD